MNLDRPTQQIVPPPGIGHGWPPVRPRTSGDRGSGGSILTAPLPDRAAERSRRSTTVRRLRREIQKDGIWLVPLRLFIAVAWLRALVEKTGEPGWFDGTSVAAFLERQLADGRVPFPIYRLLLTDVVLPNATTFGWIVLIGQCLVGTALLFGAVTNAALLGGITMNLAFLLAGETEPNVYYVVIQVALLATHTGATFGVDARLGRVVRQSLVVAQPAGTRDGTSGSWMPWAAGTVLALAIAVYGCFFVTGWSVARSVSDPALMVAVLAVLTAAWLAIGWVRAATAAGTDWTARSMDAALSWSSPVWATTTFGDEEAVAIERLGAFDLEWGRRAAKEALVEPRGWRI